MAAIMKANGYCKLYFAKNGVFCKVDFTKWLGVVTK